MDTSNITLNEIVIDENRPLSLTKLWDYQRAFYAEQGINAWADRVPFFVTSNPYIADSYASTTIRFIQDSLRNLTIDPDFPLYIVEIGGGSGAFSYHVLNKLQELRDKLSISLNIVYVMTDFVEENIQFWRSHEAFKHFIAAGMLDFSYFDVEFSSELVLMESGRRISTADGQQAINPVILFANYCFDSLRQDVFYIREKQLYQGLTRLTTHPSNLKDDRPEHLHKVDLSYKFIPAELPYYKDELWNDILGHYVDTLDNQYLLLPIGSMMCIQSFLKLSRNRLLLLSSDKGYSKYLEYYQQNEPAPVFHDNCFSMSVNFDAISRAFKLAGGDSFTQFSEQSLTTCAFVSHTRFEHLPETSLALEANLNSFGHSTINNVFLSNDFSSILTGLDTIIPFLEACKWDTWFFHCCRDVIIGQIRDGNVRIADIENLKEKLVRVEKNFYKLPKAYDTFCDIALVLQEMKDYRGAINYYQKSIDTFGDKENMYYNIGLCNRFYGNDEEAIRNFTKALSLNPEHILARGWISQIENQVSEEQKQ